MDDEDRWSVYTMRPDGSDLLRVYVSTVQANLNAPQRPVWSPDGEWIVFSNVLPNLEANIHRVRSDGSELQALTEGESLNLLPFFAQGGLYFSSDRNGEFNIYRLNLNDDAPPQAITSSPDDMFLMNVSPDGAWLHILREEFSSGSGPFGDYRLISTDGSRSQRIRAATSPEFRPTTWSPLIDMPLRAEMLVAGGMVMVGLAVMGRRRKRIRM
jgi:Tol biopolymer transport system component